LTDCGIAFEVVDGREAEEMFSEDMHLGEVAEYLSTIKSNAYADMLSDGDVLITADTVVIASGEILGKPKDRADAVRMLSLLSGAEHSVITGVTLRSVGKMRSFSCESKVRFRELTREEIEYYIDTYEPYDKVGAYGIQEWIGYVAISGIEGSFYNVMGLPVQRLYVELENFV
jgi:septum formation protein